MRVIFEDNDNTSISKLLKMNTLGIEIEFTCGGHYNNIIRKIINIYNKNIKEDIILYIDLPVNNKQAVQNYKLLCIEISKLKTKSILIIPIICIEEALVNLIRSINKRFNLGIKIHSDIDIFNLNTKSIEKSYKKEIVNIHNQINYFTIKGNSKFYNRKCICDHHKCNGNIKMEIDEKANNLYMSLPFYYIPKNIQNKFGKEIIKHSHKDLYIKLNNKFNYISDILNVERVYIRRV